MKTCRVCGETLPRSEFYAERRSADGLRAKCRRCFMAQTSARRRIVHPRLRRPDAAERFASKVLGGDGCWEWQGASGPHGYGMFRPGAGAPVYAHRFAYESAKGRVPDGFQVDHLCFNRLCVNPAHLEAVTGAENIRRANARRFHGVVSHAV